MALLEAGFGGGVKLRRESVGSGGRALRLLFASDLHLWGPLAMKRLPGLIEAAQIARPDLILLGGDLVDGRMGLEALGELVGEWSKEAPLLAVGGNHDVLFGLRQVKEAVQEGGGKWLGNASRRIRLGSKNLVIDGQGREAKGEAALRILVSHYPDVFPQAAAQGYDLVLSGHLHGCQFVFWQQGQELYPGRFFFRWNGLRYEEGESTMLVSRGAGDLLPLRFNCPRELVLCELAA